MGRTVALAGASLDFARSVFAEHYATTPPEPPTQFLRREFAYAPFNGAGMRRHLAVRDEPAFRELLAREVPRHAYYSSAYYKDPAHPIMISKGWAGADVIFDLDADHLKDASGLTYPQQLELVKRKFRVLVEDYLFRDFGLAPEDVTLAFSGGRGYHAHVHKDSFLGLSSAARRELVGYLGGGEIDLGPFLGPLEKEALVRPSAPPTPGPPVAGTHAAPAEGGPPRSQARRSKSRTSEIPHLPSPDAPGWKGRYTRSFFELLDHWEGLGVAGAAADMLERARRHGIETLRPEEAREVATALLEKGKADKARRHHVLDVGGPGRGAPIAFVRLVLAEGALLLQGEADAPVTTDIHRLIRLPGSLHGGTGLRVLRLRPDDLAGFSPLRDALLPSPTNGTGRTAVTLEEGVDYPLGGEPVRGGKGERLELPRAAALFLVLRGEATVDAPP